MYSPPAPSDKLYKWTLRANELYERHQYQDAIQEYSKIIQSVTDASSSSDAFLALLHSNRSACYLLTHQYLAARDDANRAMNLQPNWAKVGSLLSKQEGGNERTEMRRQGYYRHGEALMKLKQFDEAIRYYQQALEKVKSLSLSLPLVVFQKSVKLLCRTLIMPTSVPGLHGHC